MIYYILSAAMINRRVRTTVEMMTIWSASLLAVDGVAELAGNVISKLGENATSMALLNGSIGGSCDGRQPSHGSRQAEQCDQRCALPSFICMSTLLESTRTFDRYRVTPVACYENRVMYRKEPTAENVLTRRRRPVPVPRIGLLPYCVQHVDLADRLLCRWRPTTFADCSNACIPKVWSGVARGLQRDRISIQR